MLIQLIKIIKLHMNYGMIAVVTGIISNFLSIAQSIIGKKLSIIGQGLMLSILCTEL